MIRTATSKIEDFGDVQKYRYQLDLGVRKHGEAASGTSQPCFLAGEDQLPLLPSGAPVLVLNPLGGT